MRIFEIINYKKRELAREQHKENPDPFKIRRLKESIERHKKQSDKINKGRRGRKIKRFKRDDKKFRKRFMEG